MFFCEKPLPAPPAPPKHRNSSLAATLPTYRSRPTPGASTSSSSFSATRAMFDVISKPVVQSAVLKASQNPSVRSAAISAVKNENVQAVAVETATKENARMTIAEMARRYDTEAAKNASSSYSYNATDTKSLKKPKSIGCLEVNSQWQSPAVVSSTTANSLYPDLSNTSGSGIGFSSASSFNMPPTVNNVSKPRHSQSLNFQSIHDSLNALGLFSNVTKKAAPARPPPPKFKSSRCSLTPSTSPTNEPHAVVRYPYKSAHVDELTCMLNDVVILKKEVDDQWIYALNTRTGECGIVPIVFLNIKVPLAPTQQNSLIKGSAVSSNFRQETYVKALYDYNTSVAGDLQFFAGDKIRVTERVNNEWLRGINGIQEGIFPANFVEPVIENSSSLPPLGETANNSLNSLSLHNLSTMSSFSLNTPAVSPTKTETVTAAYDYNSGVSEDLVFKAGDVIEVIEWISSDWLRGRLNGYTGLVPSTYITRN